MFCMYEVENKPVVLWPVALRVMSNLTRKGKFICYS